MCRGNQREIRGEEATPAIDDETRHGGFMKVPFEGCCDDDNRSGHVDGSSLAGLNGRSFGYNCCSKTFY